jgi:transcriptional regulator with XRE-family HTH domain
MGIEMTEIMRRMHNRRIELNYTYQELADKTGICKSTLQRYETGSIKNMPLDKLEVVANALRVSPGFLLGWNEEVCDISADQSKVIKGCLNMPEEYFDIIHEAYSLGITAADLKAVMDLIHKFKNR